MNDNEHESPNATVRERMRSIGQSINCVINETGLDYGFVLFVFERDQPAPRVNFVSNSARETIVSLLKDFVEKSERDGDRPPPPRR